LLTGLPEQAINIGKEKISKNRISIDCSISVIKYLCK